MPQHFLWPIPNDRTRRLPLISFFMTDTQLTELFKEFWTQSYSMPPGNHTVMTHTAWGRFLLGRIQHQQQLPEQSR
jgi:hypothetical protein